MNHYSTLFILLLAFATPIIAQHSENYPWLKTDTLQETIASRIAPPKGYQRTVTTPNSFQDWLRNLPLQPPDAPVKEWDGQLKPNQSIHAAVIHLDFIGKNLQQCIDVIIRLRAEYLFLSKKADQIKFSYTCCKDPVTWSKWKLGWRTKIINDPTFGKNGRDTYIWQKTAAASSTRKTFLSYLYHIMMYAGTQSLSDDMQAIDHCSVDIGDAYVEGGPPGYGHGIIIVDQAVSATGERIVLLAQGYNPAQELHILKNKKEATISPWYSINFDPVLETPEWRFSQNHARRF